MPKKIGTVSSITPSTAPRSFNNYIAKTFKTPLDYFKKWNIEDILGEQHKWQMNHGWTSMYIIGNTHPKYHAQTYIGRVENRKVETRYHQHNGTLPGGPSDTKKVHGFCVLLFYVTLPPYRNFSSDTIWQDCQAKRGWQSKFSHALEFSRSYGLPFRISKKILDETSPFYSESAKTQLETFYPQFINVETKQLELPQEWFIENGMTNVNK